MPTICRNREATGKKCLDIGNYCLARWKRIAGRLFSGADPLLRKQAPIQRWTILREPEGFTGRSMFRRNGFDLVNHRLYTGSGQGREPLPNRTRMPSSVLREPAGQGVIRCAYIHDNQRVAWVAQAIDSCPHASMSHGFSRRQISAHRCPGASTAPAGPSWPGPGPGRAGRQTASPGE